MPNHFYISLISLVTAGFLPAGQAGIRRDSKIQKVNSYLPNRQAFAIHNEKDMPLITIALGIAVLLILIIGLRFNAFIALIIVSLGIGVALGMPITDVIDSIKKGVGSTLGYLALILGFGAMLGALMAESGAAQNITTQLIDKFGVKNIHWAVILTGFIVGVPMFYSVPCPNRYCRYL